MATTIEREATHATAFLRTPAAIRERCHTLLERALDDDLDHFAIDLDRLPALVDRVLELTKRRYPTLDVPFHSRFRHFDVGGRDRAAELMSHLSDRSAVDRARSIFELVVVSVLLDAGAGSSYRYVERDPAATFARSEALAVASYHMFASGMFSSVADQPCSVDAEALTRLSAGDLARGFQVDDDNPLVGLEGRTALLSALGRVVSERTDVFTPSAESPSDDERPRRLGWLFDHLVSSARDGRLTAAQVLDRVLDVFGPIWPGRIFLGHVNLGDVFRHPKAGGAGLTAGLVPFHKLSQWLTYSLIDALERSSVTVAGVAELTGLAEYRNGGLLIDSGVLRPRHDDILTSAFAPSSEVIVEWRALTVALLDRIADACRERLGKSAVELPLAKILEGGTWAAGRELAYERRPDGSPPIRIESDGTVF